jgi:amphi-Trp domain-containing protein
MGKDSFEFARIASPDEIADYLTSLAGGLKRGEVTLESGSRALRLTPASDLKLELKVKRKDDRGKIEVEIGWKGPGITRAADLRVEAGRRRGRA